MEESADQNPNSDAPDKTLTFNSLFYLIVIIGIGVPVWVKTTAPVRYSLPDIAALMVHAQMMTHHIPITIVVFDKHDDQHFIQDLGHQLSNQWPRKVSTDGSMSFALEWTVRPASQEEHDLWKSSQTISDLDNHLSLHGSNDGEIRVYLLPQTVMGSNHMLAGHSRSLFLPAPAHDDDLFAETIFSSIEQLIDPSLGKSMMLSAESAKESAVSFDPNHLNDPNISMWINIVMEDPLDSSAFQAKQLSQIQQISDVAVTSLKPLINLKVQTQMVFYAIDEKTISGVVTKNHNEEAPERLIDVKNMPALINSIENRVVEPDNKQSFYLNVIIPSSGKSSTPLLFWRQGDHQKSNILLTAAKGGFLICNQDHDFNLGFKLLIRKLIGLDQLMPKYSIRKDVFFSEWELDSVKRSVCQKQVLKSLSSLESIEKLLDKVGNIVIGQQVSERMHEAVDLSHQAIHSLASGHLKHAYECSRKGFQLSESAFFDPSLLALLYFPDDQKYAIYFPLFLPVSLPLVSSVYHLIRKLRRT
jgi:phosphatidylinositol glycan class S